MGGHTTSIVPWDVRPTEKGTISWRSPLRGTKLSETFQYTVYFLSYQIEGTNYHVVVGTWFPLKLGPGQSVFTLFVIEKKVEAQTMKNILSIVGQVLADQKGDISQLISSIRNNVQQKFILDAIPDKTITGFRSSKYQRYYEWQYPIFTPQVMAKPGKAYHVKIIAAVGFGKALGMDIKVEVLPGPSPQAASFQKQNPQNYIEPQSGQTLTSQATTTMVSDWPKTPSNQVQSNFQAANRISPSGMSASDMNELQAAEEGQLRTSGDDIKPATLPNEISANKNSSEATTADLGTDTMLRFSARKSATLKRISTTAKKSGKPSIKKPMHVV